MYGAPYNFYFVHPIVKTVKMMVQRVDFGQNLKNICPTTVGGVEATFYGLPLETTGKKCKQSITHNLK